MRDSSRDVAHALIATGICYGLDRDCFRLTGFFFHSP